MAFREVTGSPLRGGADSERYQAAFVDTGLLIGRQPELASVDPDWQALGRLVQGESDFRCGAHRIIC